MTHYITALNREAKQRFIVLVDILLLLIAAWFAYLIRAEGDSAAFTPNVWQFITIVAAPVLALPIFTRMGLYRSIIRYLGEQALWTIVKAVTLLTIIWTLLGFFLLLGGKGWEGLPRAVPLIFWLLAVVFITASRFSARWLLWAPIRRQYPGKQVLIYGAGEAGQQLAASLKNSREYFPTGFLDDDPELQHKDINGIRVYSPQQIPFLIENFGIQDIIITLPSASQAQRTGIVKSLEQYKLKVRILPAMVDIASGKHLVSQIREVDISDLLGRDSIAADPQLLSHSIKGKNVMVTGAAGSIGSELCRQIVALNPAHLIILEQSEPALYHIDRELHQRSSTKLSSILGSVKDQAFLQKVITAHQVHTLYHAAAHKHVPLVEDNIIEGIRNNTFGTWNAAEAAWQAGVETFVLISTDKAVRPTNIMGATKRWAELIMQHFAMQARIKNTGQRFCAVRFGNVLGSSGSVIPLFKQQIAQGGPITVTHPEITRYFMSIHEAVELVIQASSLAKGGDIFLLDMGEAVKITQLAKDMIHLAGQQLRDENNPEGDIAIVFTGLRPGEKLYEEWLIDDAQATRTRHPKILRANEPFMGEAEFMALIQQLSAHLNEATPDLAKALLMQAALSTHPKI